ncbi:MAG: hypothetical protein ACOC3V_04160 [bacterium]
MIKEVFVPIEEFLENGGQLKEGRTIYDNQNTYYGDYVGFDNELSAHYIKNSSWKSIPICESVSKVKIEVKPIYK